MKKSLIGIFVLVFTPLVAFARPADPNRFPKYQPLHEQAPNVQPDLSGNINSATDTLPPTEGKESSEVNGGESADNHDSAAGKAAAGTEAKLTNRPWFGYAAGGILLLIILAAYVYFRNRKNK